MSSRPEHIPSGYLCECGLLAEQHRKRRSRPGRIDTRIRIRERVRAKASPKLPREFRAIGIDGEGRGRFPHVYDYLAASDSEGNVWEVSDSRGIRTSAALDLILSLPEKVTICGFSFNYDLTKILAELPNESLYRLFHEQERIKIVNGRTIFKPVRWEGYRLNYMNRRFSVRKKGGHQRVVWDVFSFFQTSFVNALKAWGIADEKRLERMIDMKGKRAEFDALEPDQIRAYCKEECKFLAELVESLYKAHMGAGLKLRDFYGAGSTSSALLKKIGIKKQVQTWPAQMSDAVSRAFFGGRFENSVLGPIEGKVYNYDISSAYPYHMTRLPCLIHGRWVLTESVSVFEQATIGLVRYRFNADAKGDSWGPFPVRTKEGSIIFPRCSVGGWCWGNEFKAAALWKPELASAWVYYQECDCQPFKAIPETYLERLALGKDGKGIVLKLGMNGGYGKFAQSKGLKPPFQNYVYAGIITSNTRAQLLEAISCAKDPWAIKMLATDGIFSTEQLELPKPVNTGTFSVAKPLGGWEEKVYNGGMFAARPGIYFPLDPAEQEPKDVKARGLGKAIIQKQWHVLVDAYARGEIGAVIGGMTQFIGIKGALNRAGDKVNRSEKYGEWIPQQTAISFHPSPKRTWGGNGRLLPIDYYPHESEPYSHAVAKEAQEKDPLAQDLDV